MPQRYINVLHCLLVVCLPMLANVQRLDDFLLLYAFFSLLCGPAAIGAALMVIPRWRWSVMLYAWLLTPALGALVASLPTTVREVLPPQAWVLICLGVVWGSVLALRYRLQIARVWQDRRNGGAAAYSSKLR